VRGLCPAAEPDAIHRLRPPAVSASQVGVTQPVGVWTCMLSSPPGGITASPFPHATGHHKAPREGECSGLPLPSMTRCWFRIPHPGSGLNFTLNTLASGSKIRRFAYFPTVQ
jgi:hypothetical protein